jgi:hypothetical protein
VECAELAESRVRRSGVSSGQRSPQRQRRGGERGEEQSREVEVEKSEGSTGQLSDAMLRLIYDLSSVSERSC